MSYENNKSLQIGIVVKRDDGQGHFGDGMMELRQDEGGRTLGILVCIEEEAPGCIKQDLLTQIDPGVFEHDFPLAGPSRWMLIPLLCREDSMIS